MHTDWVSWASSLIPSIERILDKLRREKVSRDRDTLNPTYVRFEPMTTTERNALPVMFGMVIYNSTDSQLQARTPAGWVNL
jgi:hypothetical protein